MMVYLSAFIMMSMLSMSAGLITNCCEQGRKIGNKVLDGPVCIEKNLNYDDVGRVSKDMCKKVFLSCCKHSAMEQNCKLGVQSAINGYDCKAGKEMGGKMKNDCCMCCKQGFLAANHGQPCDEKEGDMMCVDSFTACCNNARLSLKTTAVPVTAAPVKAVNCSAHGCQQGCVKGDDGKVNCQCKNGYKLKEDQKSCEDIDECAEGTATCDPGSMCQNEPGNYMCIKRVDIKETPCPQAGYIRNAKGVCVDIDECASGTAKCGDNQYCINTDGYYACFRSCPYGYKAVGKTCLDIDECAISNPCQKSYKCVNMKGYYRCQLVSCESGFELKGDRCVDVDECSRGLHNCGAKYTCQNNNGGFRCQLSACIRGFRLANGQCLDINECVETPSICGRGTCYNTYGAFSCNCFPGFQFNSETSKCEDIDECKRSPGICEAGCINTAGSYKCSCPAGYRSFGNNCEDIDECAVSKNRCPDNHVCVNEFGSFTCINATCPNQYYVQRSPYECRLYCPGNHGACSDLVIKSIKWRTQKFRKVVDPRGFKFQYSLRVSTYLKVQINFSLVSGNENGEFFLQRLNENTVDLINIKKLVGPRKYTLRLDTDVLFRGKVSSKFVYFFYLSLSKYNF